jgi:hypothetical protein
MLRRHCNHVPPQNSCSLPFAGATFSHQRFSPWSFLNMKACSSDVFKWVSRSKVGYFVIGFIFVVFPGTAARAWSFSWPTLDLSRIERAQETSTSRIEVEILKIEPSGFQPAEISRPAGPFVLIIRNRSGAQGLLLRLRRRGAEGFREIQLSRRRTIWRGQLDLPAGTYVLAEVNHPQWVLNINISPR